MISSAKLLIQVSPPPPASPSDGLSGIAPTNGSLMRAPIGATAVCSFQAVGPWNPSLALVLMLIHQVLDVGPAAIVTVHNVHCTVSVGRRLWLQLASSSRRTAGTRRSSFQVRR